MDEMNLNQALERLQQIVELVNSEELAIEKSLELLEEGVELANFLTEKMDFSPEDLRE